MPVEGAIKRSFERAPAKACDAQRTKVTGDHQGAQRRRRASVLTAWLGILCGNAGDAQLLAPSLSVPKIKLCLLI